MKQENAKEKMKARPPALDDIKELSNIKDSVGSPRKYGVTDEYNIMLMVDEWKREEEK